MKQSDNPIGRNITPGHVRAFQAVTSRLYDNITLWSCAVNGEAGVAIVMVDDASGSNLAVMPLFVAITEGMDIDFDGSKRGSGGGSRRPRNRFDEAGQEVTGPSPA